MILYRFDLNLPTYGPIYRPNPHPIDKWFLHFALTRVKSIHVASVAMVLTIMTYPPTHLLTERTNERTPIPSQSVVSLFFFLTRVESMSMLPPWPMILYHFFTVLLSLSYKKNKKNKATTTTEATGCGSTPSAQNTFHYKQNHLLGVYHNQQIPRAC